MNKIICQHHQDKNVKPTMIYFGKNSLGKEYICAVCSGIRTFNTGKIIKIKPESQYGFINGIKDNIFFHFSNLAYDFRFHKGMPVSYEVSFENNRIQAVNIKPFKGGNNDD